MTEITFLSNKSRKETYKYFFAAILAVITWTLQVSILSKLLCFDTAPNLMLLGTIYCGLTLGPAVGTFFGITSSFLSASILYDHTFYFSYPLIGLIAGLFTKNIFSDELLFFTLLSFLFTFPLEFLNSWQFSLKNPIEISNRYLLVSSSGAFLNLALAPLFYLLIRFVTKKLKLW